MNYLCYEHFKFLKFKDLKIYLIRERLKINLVFKRVAKTEIKI